MLRVKNVVRLLVFGFECEADAISELIGTSPTRIYARGDAVIPGKPLRRKENGWLLQSPVNPWEASVDEAVRALFQLLPDVSALRRLPHGCETRVLCAVYSYDARPGIELSAEAIGQLALSGADLDLDIYDLSDGGEEVTADSTPM